MEPAELVLRWVALADRLEDYKPLRQFLNEYMRQHRATTDETEGLLEAFQGVRTLQTKCSPRQPSGERGDLARGQASTRL
jgi:hypothetical protein